jgi:uncharacterized protein (DUF2237 family)
MNRGRNVLGEEMEDCGTSPMTGFFGMGVVALGPMIWVCIFYAQR